MAYGVNSEEVTYNLLYNNNFRQEFIYKIYNNNLNKNF